jgi:fructose-1,6-bisphosphatase/sedoheptulose 1,7-bisphosphatase-like protein
MMYTIIYKNLKIEQHEAQCNFSSTCTTNGVTLLGIQVKIRVLGKDWIVITKKTEHVNMWSSVTQIFRND